MSDEHSAFASFERKWLDANPEQAAVLVFLPRTQRARASAFGTLIHELTQTAFSVREVQVAAAKLSWWQQELVGAAAGNPRHPISRELFRDQRATALDSGLWRELIDGAIAQLDVSSPTTSDNLFATLSDFFEPVALIETQLMQNGASQNDAIAQLWACSHLMRSVTLPPDFISTIRDTIEKNQRLATQATLGTRVRTRGDRWLADHAVRADDPAQYLSRHARNLRWRSLWWAWREARSLTSRSAIPT
jgi:phytoene synthase